MLTHNAFIHCSSSSCAASCEPSANLSPKFSDAPPLPPPSFSARQMPPPPSSPQMPQAQNSSHPASSRGPPLLPAFPTSRDLPTPSPITRPESSMSISSMLGSDSTRPSREQVSTVAVKEQSPMRVAALPSPRMQIGSVPSPPQTRDHATSLYQRSRSPERAMFVNSQTSRPTRAYSGGALRHQMSNTNVGSSDVSRLASLSGPFNSQYSPKSDNSPLQDWKPFHDGRPSLKRPYERPNSQPVDSITRSSEFDKSLHLRPVTSEAESVRPADTKQFQSAKYGEGAMETAKPEREDSSTNGYLDLRIRHALEQQTLQPASQGSPTQKGVSSSVYPFLSKPIPPSPEMARVRRETDPLSTHSVVRDQPAPTPSPFNPESIRRLREERLIGVSAGPQQTPTPSPSNASTHLQQVNGIPRQNVSQGPSVPLGLETPRAGGQEQPVKADEANLNNHRGSLALLLDNSRRGRISPLPQAVQGAQARVSGPASDPGIKSEFARMFIGIGSGVGRAGRLGSGTSTPFSPSPTKNIESGRKTPITGRGEPIEISNTWVGSKGGRKGRKAKEEEPRLEAEVKPTEINAGAISARGIKRTRHSHHHHPHQHSHQ